MKNIFFSLIVPVYNVEKYLGRCLDSILLQDYIDYEIICVNDGSTDGSLNILQEYSSKYKNIKVISQENQGLGAARNTGLKHIAGDFVWFIDSDDWIEEGSLQALNRFILQNPDNNIVIANAFRTNEKGYKSNFYALSKFLRKNKFVNTESYIKSLLYYDSSPSAWLKVFKKNVIESYEFSKGFFEDVPLIRIYHRANIKIGYLDKPLYNYFYREDSIMTKIDKRLLDMFSQYDLVYNEYHNVREYKKGLTHLLYYWTGIQMEKVRDTGCSEIMIALQKEFKKRKSKVLPFACLMFSSLNFRRKIKLLLYKFRLNL